MCTSEITGTQLSSWHFGGWRRRSRQDSSFALIWLQQLIHVDETQQVIYMDDLQQLIHVDHLQLLVHVDDLQQFINPRGCLKQLNHVGDLQQ